jgi:hypothetical protein
LATPLAIPIDPRDQPITKDDVAGLTKEIERANKALQELRDMLQK